MIDDDTRWFIEDMLAGEPRAFGSDGQNGYAVNILVVTERGHPHVVSYCINVIQIYACDPEDIDYMTFIEA